MKKYIIGFMFGLYSVAGFAHQPEISSTVLAEMDDNKWVLQISASLSAFQEEIKIHFSESPYETPDDFREMVLQHIANNLHFRFNETEGLKLNNGKVMLGHETKVIFEVTGMPSEIESAEVTNFTFKDIHRSQSALVLLKKDFAKNQFLLNDANDYKINLVVAENEFVINEIQKASFSSLSMIFLIIGTVGLAFVIRAIYYFKERVFRKVS
ncbi:hypothetical protein [Christiangramia echinicola]|uniref:Uncharacterized protein n=1 Tax=Christiangramia echinicola TaxID=279359 RepID=A0A1H1KZ20_9FLAO|nr:hypothetical protein [Christiangramia echinicola]SDR67598.1 hypothetical protein SAMN04488552_0417 [Christiangramia echinicola]